MPRSYVQLAAQEGCSIDALRQGARQVAQVGQCLLGVRHHPVGRAAHRQQLSGRLPGTCITPSHWAAATARAPLMYTGHLTWPPLLPPARRPGQPGCCCQLPRPPCWLPPAVVHRPLLGQSWAPGAAAPQGMAPACSGRCWTLQRPCWQPGPCCTIPPQGRPPCTQPQQIVDSAQTRIRQQQHVTCMIVNVECRPGTSHLAWKMTLSVC